MTKIQDLHEAWSENAKFDIEVCTHCNTIWFDKNEHTYMSKESLSNLACTLIELANPNPIIIPTHTPIACEVCRSRMTPMQNLVNGEPFMYHMCPNECGVFMSIEDFLKLHKFIRKPKTSDEFATNDNDSLEQWEKESVLFQIQKMLHIED